MKFAEEEKIGSFFFFKVIGYKSEKGTIEELKNFF